LNLDLDLDLDPNFRIQILKRKNISKGERICHRILFDMQIDYASEYIFDKLQNRRYDFKFNFNNLECILEIDGPFHFDLKKLGHKIRRKYFYIYMKKFSKSRESDIIKTIFCINNNISCLRIHYSIHLSYDNMKLVIKKFLEQLQNSNKPVYMLSHPEYYIHLFENDIIRSKFFKDYQ